MPRKAIIAAAARLLLHFVTHQNSEANARWISVSETVLVSPPRPHLTFYVDRVYCRDVRTQIAHAREALYWDLGLDTTIWMPASNVLAGVQILKFRTDRGFLPPSLNAACLGMFLSPFSYHRCCTHMQSSIRDGTCTRTRNNIFLVQSSGAGAGGGELPSQTLQLPPPSFYFSQV